MAAMNRTKVFHSNFFSMGTRMDIVLPHVDDEEGDEIYQSIRLEVKRLEKKLSRFDKNGAVYYVNAHAFKDQVALDSELYSIVRDCQDYYRKTKKIYDIDGLGSQEEIFQRLSEKLEQAFRELR